MGFTGKVSQWVTKATGLSRASTNTDQPKGKTRIQRRRKPEMRLHMSCSIVLEMEETQVWPSDHWLVQMNISWPPSVKANGLYTPHPINKPDLSYPSGIEGHFVSGRPPDGCGDVTSGDDNNNNVRRDCALATTAFLLPTVPLKLCPWIQNRPCHCSPTAMDNCPCHHTK